jgi:hypothetical protein
MAHLCDQKHQRYQKLRSKVFATAIYRQKSNRVRRGWWGAYVFTGIINSAGFIRHSRTYEGNKADIATLEDMITDLEKHNDNTKDKIIVMDAGFASEDNLKFLDNNGYKYVCVSRQRLKDEIIETIKSKHSVEDRLGNKIELAVFNHVEYSDTWMYVKSEQKRVKEESITIKLCQRFEEELQGIENALHKKGGTKKTEKVWERIGRCKEKNRNVSGRYNIEVEQENSKATKVIWTKKLTKEKTISLSIG